MLYIILIMVLIFLIIVGVQYKLATDEGEVNWTHIIETSLIWSTISYIIIGLIVLGISFLVSLES
ncbi:hypothetical protein [Persephonella sp. KM09-Lau-8]|uniref:hypothetical protein n=1 Tax=Persephonella sp. KM09-Lau-8 TaxID=1158345 RepID=UPI0004952AC5|nr:hypothetical protein [Persephonella sp. KM09-Lau-8]